MMLAIEELMFVDDVPNFIHCSHKQTDLDLFVCGNEDFLKMFQLLSMANVYAYENARKIEVDHKTFNEKNMNHWIEKYNVDTLNENTLCYDLKVATTNFLGGMSPYKIVSLEGDVAEDFIVQQNKHGLVLSNRNGYIIYIGVDNDVLDSNKKTGHWHKENNKFFISLNGHEISFYYDENE